MSLNGIDVSHYQDGINLAKIQADFVIMKATQGTWMVDNCCDSHYQEAKAAGKLLGVYHFADGTGTPEQEADYFLKHTAGYIGGAILVLDWEEDITAQGPAWAKRWLDRVYQKTGVRPLIYMSYAITRQYNWKQVAEHYGLWVSRYYQEPIRSYQKDPFLGDQGTGAFSVVAMYQYSRTGRFPGIWDKDVDLDIAYMTKEAWGKYAKGNGSTVIDKNPVREIILKDGETLIVKG